MKNLNIALRSLFKKGRSNGIKILSLGVGLAMGLVLISKVCFERSFDKFYPDSDRIYRLHENIIRDGEYKSYGQVSGGVATAMQVEIPEVEKATRLTYIGGDKELFKTQDGNRYSARYVVMGDTNVFDLLPRPILSGDPKETLSRPGYVMISNRIAKLLGGAEQAVNKEFEFESSPGQTYTIGGVFEDVPENSHLRFEIVASLEGMSKWSRENWLGNDRYLGYVKLYPGTDPESLTTAIREMQGRHCDLEEVKKAGIDLTYSLVPLMDMHSNSDEVKSMNSLLGFLAFVLIFTAAMNYVLIVISTLINRTKEVAVHKCYGASDKNLFGMIMSETCLHMLISLLLAAFLIVLFRTKTEELLGATLGALFSTQTIVILIGVCIVIFFITGLIPTYMFLRIPVGAAFRNFKESRRYWILCLLFIQFLATAYLVALLSVIKPVTADQDRHGKDQLRQSKVQRIPVHIQKGWQRQGKWKHMSHGNVEQRNGKTDSRDYTVSGGLQMLLLLLPFLFLLFPVLFLLQKAGAVSCLGHGLTYHAGSHLILIIGNPPPRPVFS